MCWEKIDGLWKSLAILILILVVSLAIHEGVHVWQCYDDANMHFMGFQISWNYVAVAVRYSGVTKYDLMEMETQAYGVQIAFIAFLFGFYALKKEMDKQIAEELLNRIKTKYFQEVKT
jgi:hypothetical protein